MEVEKLEKYEADFKLIKDLLLETQETPALEHWAFYIWGILSLIGVGLSVWCNHLGWSAWHLLLAIWLPVLVAGSVGETLAWIVRSRKESVPLLNRMVLRFLLSAMGVILVMLFVIVLLVLESQEVLLIQLILPFVSVIFFLYSLATYRVVAYIGFVALALGVLFLFLFPPSVLAVVSGVISSLLILLAGVVDHLKENSRKKK